MEPQVTIPSSSSAPRLLIGVMAFGGVALIGTVFCLFGPLVAAVVALFPALLCLVWFSVRNPVVSMFGMFILNYYIMALGRQIPDAPVGLLLDAAIAFNILMVTLQALIRPMEWRQARSGLTAVAALWLAYCLLELLNPQMISLAGWFMTVRSVSFYFFCIVILTQVTFNRFKHLKYMLAILSVLTLTAVAKALIQKYIGFTASENYWLFVLGGYTTHIIRTGVRYFSFFSDAANFGASMGFSMVLFSIAAIYYRNRWMKFYMLLVAGAACYGMLISGTRSALAVPFVGYAVFVVLSRNYRIMVLGTLMIAAAYIFLNYTHIGHGNPIIRRARSAFDTQDASFQVRLENQAKFRELMRGKYFGAGLGQSGKRGAQNAPTAALAQIPTDSWFVMIWVETGPVGLILHILILLYVLGWGSYLVIFKLRDKQVRGFTTALISGSAGIVVMSYGNEVLGQFPTGLILYTSMAFIFLSERFDEQTEAALSAASQTPARPEADA